MKSKKKADKSGTFWFVFAGLIGWIILQIVELTIFHPAEKPFELLSSVGSIIYWAGAIAIGIFLFLTLWLLSWQRKVRSFAMLITRTSTYRKFAFWTVVALLLILVALAVVFHTPKDSSGNQVLYLISIGFGQFRTYFYFLGYLLLTALVCYFLDLIREQGPETEREGLSTRNLLVVLAIVILQIVFFCIFIFSIYLLVQRIPFNLFVKYWYFDYKEVIPPIHLGKLFGLAILFTALLALTEAKVKRGWILIFVVIGVLLQFTFPLIEDGNLGRIEFRVRRLGSGAYAEAVCYQESIAKLYENYEEYGSDSGWIITKPPGFLVPYYLIKGLLTATSPGMIRTASQCQTTIKTFLLYATPWLSMGALFLLAVASRRLYPSSKRHLPGLVFILMPNMILFTGMPDQFMIPSIFLILTILSIETSRRESFVLAILTGVWYAICINYSYSLAGTLAFPLLLVGFQYLLTRHKRKLPKTLLLIGLILGGAIAGIVLIQLLTGFNLFEGISAALSSHQSFIKIKNPLKEASGNLIVNNVEYLLWIGPPVAMLFLSGSLAHFSKLPLRRAEVRPLSQAFLLATTVFYFTLNLSGQNRAEVARLWLFVNSLIALAVPHYLESISRRKQKFLILILIFAQLILIYLLNQPFEEMFETIYPVGFEINLFIHS